VYTVTGLGDLFGVLVPAWGAFFDALGGLFRLENITLVKVMFLLLFGVLLGSLCAAPGPHFGVCWPPESVFWHP